MPARVGDAGGDVEPVLVTINQMAYDAARTYGPGDRRAVALEVAYLALRACPAERLEHIRLRVAKLAGPEQHD